MLTESQTHEHGNLICWLCTQSGKNKVIKVPLPWFRSKINQKAEQPQPQVKLAMPMASNIIVYIILVYICIY